jgi:dTMP kinase
MACQSASSKLAGILMFITFEGIEGSGKSLQIARSHSYLQQKGVACLVTREPGGTDFGLALRKVLLGTDGCRREPWSELLLYLADRYQHLKEVIQPASKRGLVVLSDRYQDATRAYQGAARGIPEAEIEKLTQLLGIIEPDKTILLDLEPGEGLSRARKRNLENLAAAAEGRFEAEDLAFHRRVREAYLKLAARFPNRIHTVNASGSPDEVFSRIAPLLDNWFPAAG